MIKKFVFIVLSVLFFQAFSTASYNGEGGEGDDKKNPEKATTATGDSTLKDSVKVTARQDDTLVFEDWEQPNQKQSNESMALANSNVSNSGNKRMKIDAGAVLEQYIQVQEKKYEVNFSIYPNPTSDVLNVNSEIAPESLKIMTLRGELIRDVKGENALDVRDITPGTYVVVLVFSDHIETRKFVKKI